MSRSRRLTAARTKRAVESSPVRCPAKLIRRRPASDLSTALRHRRLTPPALQPSKQHKQVTPRHGVARRSPRAEQERVHGEVVEGWEEGEHVREEVGRQPLDVRLGLLRRRRWRDADDDPTSHGSLRLGCFSSRSPWRRERRGAALLILSPWSRSPWLT
ncbi:Os06g0166050 [Oryza sativa Japonica Group]|uniref:Os06g0166050 protein n=1 Tax=Oryza sativa subsp. japonica TaxID=39947 RepID=A0A0P0WSU8_ORYSJ|nr:hypothetical protein EE612_032147 [Oryza sativa]BAS96332.1 Os06g0166050 [Oryza sativa Japonica Group]